MLDQFADLGQHYPGSRERRQAVASAPAAGVEEDPLGKGTVMVLRGREVEFFTIGQLARALNRKAGTLRSWEANGILPPPGYQKPSKDPRGIRRLYTRAQCEGIIQLAKELRIIDADARKPLHEFSDRAWALFNDLKGAAR